MIFKQSRPATPRSLDDIDLMGHYRLAIILIITFFVILIPIMEKDIKGVRTVGFFAMAFYVWPMMQTTWNSTWNEPILRRLICLGVWMSAPVMAYCWLPAIMALIRIGWKKFGEVVAYLNSKTFDD